MSTLANASFNSLPVELRELIANRLDSEDVYAFSATSKANHTASFRRISEYQTGVLDFLNDIVEHYKALMTLLDPNSLCAGTNLFKVVDDYFGHIYADKFYESYQELVRVVNDVPGVNISTLLDIWELIRHNKLLEYSERFWNVGSTTNLLTIL